MRTALLRTSFCLAASAVLIGCAGGDPNLYEIETPKGTMVIRLYDETPLHRDNFRTLAADAFYDSTLFHRTIPGFMIQGGDPLSRDADPTNDGMGGPGYTISAEFSDSLFHKRGVLAAARNNNPEKASSGSQFYIVHGRVFSDEELTQYEAERSQAMGTPYRIPAGRREVYTTQGGVPWLDGDYTVFGEVIEGFDVLDAIATADTPNTQGRRVAPNLGDQPIEPIPMIVRAHSR